MMTDEFMLALVTVFLLLAGYFVGDGDVDAGGRGVCLLHVLDC